MSAKCQKQTSRRLTDIDQRSLPHKVDISRAMACCQCKAGEIGSLGGANYSIASSAVASSVGDISRPSVLAVFKLITNSNLVDCMTGRSDGFSPLSMRAI